MLDSSFAILDLSALDFGRDSIAIYDIKITVEANSLHYFMVSEMQLQTQIP